ncbi:MAG: ATP-binding cassette domain-containing protein [Treponema sp.]|nr:ATP-binding cassette domain-containing protein [Treponema sp.]
MLLTLENISQIFSTKVALDNINLTFESNKIYAVLGENGAGKSTLASILCGDRQPYSGNILLDGKKSILKSPADALAKGIVLVHQRPLLAESISVKENIFLGSENTKVSYRFLNAHLEMYRKRGAAGLNLNAKVKDIGSDFRFYTALLSALCKEPEILILDEPSVFLNTIQRKKLYENLKEFVKNGKTAIVITHSIDEAKNYADKVIYLKKGQLIATDEKAIGIAESAFNSGYNQESVPDSEKKSDTKTKTEIKQQSFISFSNVTLKPVNRPALFNISFSAEAGQITLIQGVEESGLETLENLVTGMEENFAQGTVTLSCSKDIFSQTSFTLDLTKKHLTTDLLRGKNKKITGIIPSNRVFRASNPLLKVEQILCVYYEGKDTEKYSREIIKNAGVNITPEDYASSLSGGMLQRLILERELTQNPQFLILCEPLQGLDSAASSSLCKRIAKLAEEGKTIIVLSTADFPKSICNKVYKLSGGELKNEK